MPAATSSPAHLFRRQPSHHLAKVQLPATAIPTRTQTQTLGKTQLSATDFQLQTGTYPQVELFIAHGLYRPIHPCISYEMTTFGFFQLTSVLCTAHRHRERTCWSEALQGRSCEQSHGRLRPASRLLKRERTSQAHENRDGMSEMRNANERNPSTDSRATAYTAGRQETVRRGLRILARMIARAHLRRQADRHRDAPRRSVQSEDDG